MDIGMFKASRARLVFWIILPPLLVVGVGLSAYALRLRAEWELNRTTLLSDVLPELVHTQQQARDLLKGFHESAAVSIRSEDELISFIQEVERRSDFTVDSLEVERRNSGDNMPVLVALVKGAGTFEAIQEFMGDVAAGQYLLSGTSLKVSQGGGDSGKVGMCRAEITFELLLLDSMKTFAGGGK